ncbi:MAG: nucleotidyltransferase family protein [Synergistaceae bacterium]|jgi:predicted nucleotidyltransferase|nr:nucleotidyltransferase family protein [Synergistaceae bacterium]
MKTLNFTDPVIGIAAEYDPFHNGHAFHITRAHDELAEAPVVVVLSSSFTQRGLPALVSKRTRTRMALAGGVDLVLELPFFWACSAGPDFARGAVDIFAATGFVTHLAFGVESLPPGTKTSISALHMAVDILIHESRAFKLNLKKALNFGASYPKAVAGALDRECPGLGAFTSAPNNSLALSYLLRVREKNYRLIPLPVAREGAGHRDGGSNVPFASGMAIRAALAGSPPETWGRLWVADAMPRSSLALLREEEEHGRLCAGAGPLLWHLLRGLLARSTPESLRECAGMDEGLENLFLRHWTEADSYEDFIGRCVCARYTRNRLQRQAIRCLAGLSRAEDAALTRFPPPYIRVLGFNERGRTLLRARKRTLEKTTPVITRLAAAQGQTARLAAELEFRASRLRELLLPVPDLHHEQRARPLTQ